MAFLVHETDRGWLIIDMLRRGISELALRRGDFAAAATGGGDVLAGELNERVGILTSGG